MVRADLCGMMFVVAPGQAILAGLSCENSFLFYQIYDSLLYGRSLHSDGDDDDELLYTVCGTCHDLVLHLLLLIAHS